MSDSPVVRAFELTPRQRRLRTLTVILLAVILVMLTVAIFHPFFHPTAPQVLTERVRRAIAIQGIFILSYIAVIFTLAVGLIIIAWLYTREIRLQLLMAQRDIWKDIVDRHGESQRAKMPKRNGKEE
jgi:hypothetical protein